MRIHPETIIVRIPDIVSSPVEEELVMFSVEQGKYYGLNAAAAEIWRLIEQPLAFERLCAELRNIFDVTADQCREETLHYLEELHDRGLVEVQN